MRSSITLLPDDEVVRDAWKAAVRRHRRDVPAGVVDIEETVEAFSRVSTDETRVLCRRRRLQLPSHPTLSIAWVLRRRLLILSSEERTSDTSWRVESVLTHNSEAAFSAHLAFAEPDVGEQCAEPARHVEGAADRGCGRVGHVAPGRTCSVGSERVAGERHQPLPTVRDTDLQGLQRTQLLEPILSYFER
jgi:hypothetical protein